MMENLVWGLEMAVVGMGLVFGLLALLWGLLTLVLRLDKRPADMVHEPLPETLVAGADGAPAPGPAVVQGMDAELVAAILIATLTHRAVRRREAAPAMRSHWPGSLLHASRGVAAGRSKQNHSWQRRGR
jgi:hypothetical protein